MTMFATPFIDSVLLKIFRFRTRTFLRMQDSDGRVPPVPREGGCYLYVHVPFCEVLCPFCSFHRVQHCHEQALRYFKALRAEIWQYHQAGHKFEGAYFGGGTPTIEPDELIETIGLVRRLFGVKEVSVETNPKDLEPGLLARLKAAGVTRLSVGVQSFDDDLLHEMERYDKYGSGEETAARIKAAAGLFPTLNVDLIFNQAHQTAASLERDLDIFLTLGANQVSCYPLMSAPSVKRRMETAMGVPDHDRLRHFYETIRRKLLPEFTATSGWCFTRHAQGTDEYIVAAENYVGVGSGAFSYLDGTLHSTSFSLLAYEKRIAQGLTGIVAHHRLSTGDALRYTLLVRMFGLGLDRAWARRRHGRKFFWRLWGELRTLEVLGAAKRSAWGWKLTPNGSFWLMLMMSEFFEAVNTYRDAMRAHVQQELTAAAKPAPAATNARPVQAAG